MRAALRVLPGLRGTAFVRPAAAVSRVQDEPAGEQFETVCVEGFPNATPAMGAKPAAILPFVHPRTSPPDTSARLNTIPRCSLPKPSAIADASVWLECSGDLIDVRSVDVLRIREATPGIELVEFACPRCRTPHASLRFG